MNEEFSSNQILTVYHATSKASADSILKCFDEKFEGLIDNRKCLGAGFLEADPIIARGMKAGAAVYFGLDKEYCIGERKTFSSNITTRWRLLRNTIILYIPSVFLKLLDNITT